MRRACWFAAALAITGTASQAQDYPVKPIRLFAAEPGGGADVMARVIGQELTVRMGQQVVIENRGGASGAIAAEYVARSAPDGYTLLIYSGVVWLLPFMRNKVPFDVFRDFVPISLAASSPNVLATHPALPVNSARDLIALAKRRPGELAYSSGGSGTTIHLSGELFKAMAGVNILHVPYKNGGGALNGLIGGEVQLSFLVAAAAIPQIKSGKIKALGVTSAQPSELVPGVPTIAATIPGYAAEYTTGVYAPTGTPEAILTRLNRELIAVLAKPEVRERFATLGVKALGSTPAELAAIVKNDNAKWGRIIRDAGIRAD